jgi:hypothetical protein
MVEFEGGKGLKLLGCVDSTSQFQNSLGHLANSVHPLNKLPHQNARFDVRRKFSIGWIDSKISTIDFFVGDKGYFPLVACKDIVAGEEIIVKYGKIYWIKLNNWIKNPTLKPQGIIDRDNRMRIREKSNNKRKLCESSNTFGQHDRKNEYDSDSSVKKAFPKSFYSYGSDQQLSYV